jgi:hypothetical protein
MSLLSIDARPMLLGTAAVRVAIVFIVAAWHTQTRCMGKQKFEIPEAKMIGQHLACRTDFCTHILHVCGRLAHTYGSQMLYKQDM